MKSFYFFAATIILMVQFLVSSAEFVPANDNYTKIENNPEYSFTNKSHIENVTLDINATTATTTSTVSTRITLNTSTSGEEVSKKSILKSLMAFFDSYSFILVLAFFSGLIIFILLVCCVLCACRSFNSSKSSLKTPTTKITNPLYDSIEFKPIRNNETDDLHRQIVSVDSPETEKLINNNDDIVIEQNKNAHLNIDASHQNSNNLNDSSLLNTTSASCSTTSMNSVVQIKQNDSAKPDEQKTPETKPLIKPEPISLPSNLTKKPNILPSSITNINETPKKSLNQLDKSPLLDQIDVSRSDGPESSGYKRFSKFTPSSLTKSTQQLLQEQKVAESKIPPAYRRTSSQSTPNENNQDMNRMSAASSRSSIPHAINFDIIKGDIDAWAENKNNFVSRSNLANSSHSSSQNIDFELGGSISDIYTIELIKKHEEISKKNKSQAKKNDASLSSSSASSSFKGNKSKNSDRRRSMNIPITEISLDPNAQSNLDKMNKNNPDSVSNYTIESEKSCY